MAVDPGRVYGGAVFEIVGPFRNVETIAAGRSIRDLRRLKKIYGDGQWRKRKAIATIRLEDGSTRTAEIHWYEAHGIGRKEPKIKRLIP